MTSSLGSWDGQQASWIFNRTIWTADHSNDIHSTHSILELLQTPKMVILQSLLGMYCTQPITDQCYSVVDRCHNIITILQGRHHVPTTPILCSFPPLLVSLCSYSPVLPALFRRSHHCTLYTVNEPSFQFNLIFNEVFHDVVSLDILSADPLSSHFLSQSLIEALGGTAEASALASEVSWADCVGHIIIISPHQIVKWQGCSDAVLHSVYDETRRKSERTK